MGDGCVFRGQGLDEAGPGAGAGPGWGGAWGGVDLSGAGWGLGGAGWGLGGVGRGLGRGGFAGGSEPPGTCYTLGGSKLGRC